MATTPGPVHPPAPTTPPADHHYDEHSGVYGFFRRHQKKLLYTAGMFTLLTFSISGPMMAWAGELFGGAREMPTILVNGKRVPIQLEDENYGRLLANYVFTAVPPGVLPYLDAGDGNQSQLGDVYAILRRAAIEEGFEFSYAEVDRAIDARRELAKAPSAAKMARDMGFASLAHYRTLVGEAMRIGTYVKLQTLALDATEARVLQQVTSDREKITLRVASFDEKKLEEQLKAASTLSEEDLRKWFDGKSEPEKRMMQAFDPPLVELKFAALLLAEGQFDPEQWKDGYLKDFTVGDDQLKGLYEQEKEHRFKLETGEFKPADDAAVKTELTRLCQAEHVMNQLMAAVRTRQIEGLKKETDEVARTQGELGTRQQALQEAEARLATWQAELPGKQKALADKPDDATLKEAVSKLAETIAATENEVFAAKDVVPAAKEAVKVAEAALQAARSAFDFEKAVRELAVDKAGFVFKATAGKKTGEEMKDLEALELGKWPLAIQGAGLRSKGDLGYMPARTTKAVAIYQAVDVDTTPLKPWDKLKPLAEGAYWTETAKKQAEDKKKAMDEALLRLAKAAIPDKVTEIEGKKQARIDEKLTAWETATQAALTKAEKQLTDLAPGTQMHTAWQQEAERKRAELARKDAQRTLFESEVTKLVETEVAAEAKKVYKDVLDQAAAEVGFTAAPVGPFARDLLEREPRADKKYDPDVVFLWRSHGKLKEGEATVVGTDFANRRHHAAVCAKVEPLAPTDVSRRDFESLRTGDGGVSFASQQADLAYRQAFTVEAVETRYQLQRPVGLQRQEASSGAPGGK
ncbi:MAG: hypothetical protein WAT39_14390 [Planctomycetota bacterium]